MAKIKLNHIYKVYDNGVKAVNDFCIDIEDKEFIVFVGPSGCGKSTTLRMIAGLEEITAGDLFIGDDLVNDMEPKQRDIAMVFQNYALYPHMTVYENMAFGLRNQRVPNNEIRERVLEAARILDIEDYLGRKPKAMSGGQRQRVALGRAIVRHPKVFLLDEPLSNLDAKLRAQMRTEITRLHKKLATTFIYVTHDQVEAMTMGTRIVVMKDGFVQQIDTPTNLYNNPTNRFVAGFIGTPQMNFFNATLLCKDKIVELKLNGIQTITLPMAAISKVHVKYLDGVKPIIFGIRSEDLHVEGNNDDLALKMEIIAIEELGAETLLYGELIGTKEEFTLATKNAVIIKVGPQTNYHVGEEVKVYVDTSRLHLFDAESELSILPPIPEISYVNAIVEGTKLVFEKQAVEIPPAIKTLIGQKKNFILGLANNSLTPGSELEFNVLEDEIVLDKRVLHLEGLENKIFMLADKDIVIKQKKIRCDVDMSKILLESEGKRILNPIDYRGVFKTKLYKTMVKKPVNGKTRKVAEFYFKINEVGILAPLEIVTKITTVLGRNAYKHDLDLVFDIKNLQIVEKGIHGIVERVDDFGKVRIAVISIGEQKVNMIVDGKFKKTEVDIVVSPADCTIFDATNDVRVV